MSNKPSTIGVNDQKVIDSNLEEPLTKVEIDRKETAQSYYNKEKNTDTKTMAVKVYSPFKNYFNGQAFSVSAENLTGPFDILPKHHSFITLLVPCELTIRTIKDDDTGPVRIAINGGVAHIKSNQLIVFLDV